MNFKKLARQFRRELTANPKKAAFLGLLAAVALYFWAPLVVGWTKGKPDAAPVSDTAAKPSDPAPQVAGGQNAASAEKTETPPLAWQEVVGLMDRDPRTLAVNLAVERRAPFSAVRKESAQPSAEPEPKGVSLAVTPQILGLTLSGTVIGTNRRLARINGRTYEEGQAIELVKEGQEIKFTLVKVEARRVVLKRDEADFELAIADPAKSRRIELGGR